MKKLVWLLLAFGFSALALAQKDESAWINLNTLRAGQKIGVDGLDRAKHTGRFLSASEAAISYRDVKGEQTTLRPEVVTVRLLNHGHRMRNTLILMGVGAGAGAGVGAALHGGCSGKSFCLDIGGAALPAAVGAVLGGLAGGVTGFFLPSGSTIYKVSSH